MAQQSREDIRMENMSSIISALQRADPKPLFFFCIQCNRVMNINDHSCLHAQQNMGNYRMNLLSQYFGRKGDISMSEDAIRALNYMVQLPKMQINGNELRAITPDPSEGDTIKARLVTILNDLRRVHGQRLPLAKDYKYENENEAFYMERMINTLKLDNQDRMATRVFITKYTNKFRDFWELIGYLANENMNPNDRVIDTMITLIPDVLPVIQYIESECNPIQIVVRLGHALRAGDLTPTVLLLTSILTERFINVITPNMDQSMTGIRAEMTTIMRVNEVCQEMINFIKTVYPKSNTLNTLIMRDITNLAIYKMNLPCLYDTPRNFHESKHFKKPNIRMVNLFRQIGSILIDEYRVRYLYFGEGNQFSNVTRDAIKNEVRVNMKRLVTDLESAGGAGIDTNTNNNKNSEKKEDYLLGFGNLPERKDMENTPNTSAESGNFNGNNGNNNNSNGYYGNNRNDKRFSGMLEWIIQQAAKHSNPNCPCHPFVVTDRNTTVLIDIREALFKVKTHYGSKILLINTYDDMQRDCDKYRLTIRELGNGSRKYIIILRSIESAQIIITRFIIIIAQSSKKALNAPEGFLFNCQLRFERKQSDLTSNGQQEIHNIDRQIQDYIRRFRMGIIPHKDKYAQNILDTRIAFEEEKIYDVECDHDYRNIVYSYQKQVEYEKIYGAQFRNRHQRIGDKVIRLNLFDTLDGRCDYNGNKTNNTHNKPIINNSDDNNESNNRNNCAKSNANDTHEDRKEQAVNNNNENGDDGLSQRSNTPNYHSDEIDNNNKDGRSMMRHLSDQSERSNNNKNSSNDRSSNSDRESGSESSDYSKNRNKYQKKGKKGRKDRDNKITYQRKSKRESSSESEKNKTRNSGDNRNKNNENRNERVQKIVPSKISLFDKIYSTVLRDRHHIIVMCLRNGYRLRDIHWCNKVASLWPITSNKHCTPTTFMIGFESESRLRRFTQFVKRYKEQCQNMLDHSSDLQFI